ncbi:MAG: HpcH/HpaI aldolase/citrate lyase family protein [Bacteroidetes bacterium]|nr:HpcH/HpaI aldolase/citrate lyase family protein [Bacteroidota bacterium]
MKNESTAGRSGMHVRSDCRVTLTLRERDGIDLRLDSRVESLYGDSIRALAYDVLHFFGMTQAEVLIEDSGALPYTIAARIETAVKRLFPQESRKYLLPFREGICSPGISDRFRRSRLYLPGNDPKLAINAGLHAPDGVILDLEDSVSPAEKDAARILVRNTLREVDFCGAERMVRINQLPLGHEDLAAVIPQHVHLILLPKVETAGQVREVEYHVDSLCAAAGIDAPVFLMPIIESAKGTMHAYDIATASESVVALAIGLEDYTADIGAERTNDGKESLWMRGAVLNAARAAGVQAIDTVFPDVDDMEGLLASVREAKSMGFDGKGCIHPRQIDVVHRGFAPEEHEIERAKRIVLAFDAAERQGLGVVALGSKMIDAPVVKRAQRTIDLALQSGMLDEHWKENADEG